MMDQKKRNNNMQLTNLLDCDLGEESSSDSDFRIEDHDEESDDFSDNSKDECASDDMSDEDASSDDDGKANKNLVVADQAKPSHSIDLNAIALKPQPPTKIPAKPVCCACLGERSDDTNEIVECDACGISVHEGCYGISDSGSISSTVSSCSTEPWFCESCRANVSDPVCELCPNRGGIFKETDVGKWVHLVCALYIPGVAFGEVDQLSSVTLFEMQYSKWGAKTCSLCEDAHYSRTGVCIGCDAGMCKTYFHVTCAQAAGLLSEAHSEEVDHADPFYAHCKIHSDKTLIKHRKRNFHALKQRMEYKRFDDAHKKLHEKPTEEQQRIERKLQKHRVNYHSNKTTKMEPWVPTQKMPRLLTTSASACRRLILKAELMGVDAAALEFQETQIAALVDVRKKWHISPAFSVEFIGYYLDRIGRVKDLKRNLDDQFELNKALVAEQQRLRESYDKTIKENAEEEIRNKNLKEAIDKLHASISALCPSKMLPSVKNIATPEMGNGDSIRPIPTPPPAAFIQRPTMSVPTAAALKMGVGFPLVNLNCGGVVGGDTGGRILSTQLLNCGICKKCNDQHLLAKCDTCHLHYHLGCLNPPLQRHPKKSKLYGWQCSECDKSEDEDGKVHVPKGPRKSRTRFSKDGSIIPCTSSEVDEEKTPEKPFDSRDSSLDVIKDDLKDFKQISRKRTITGEMPTTDLLDELNSSEKKIKTEENGISEDVNHEPLKHFDSGAIENCSIGPMTSTPKDGKTHHKSKSNKKSKREKNLLHINSRNEPSSVDLSAVPPNTSSFTVAEIAADFPENKPNASATGDDQTTDPATTFDGSPSGEKRKKRKDKHKSKHHSMSDTERTPTSAHKEHKRKRKKKSHDIENPNTLTSSTSFIDCIPRIKIKFKALPAHPGETPDEPKCYYVSADTVRAAGADDSSQSLCCEPTESPTDDSSIVIPSLLSPSSKRAAPNNSASTSELTQQKPQKITMPGKRARRASLPCPSAAQVATMLATAIPAKELSCDVCRQPGSPQNLVKCDECKKSYHFTCLDPPLKKTPKRRGYSWHCADCDPTDNEGN